MRKSIILLVAALVSTALLAQTEEGKQRLAAYNDKMADRYEAKYLNLKARDVGKIGETEHSDATFYLLRRTDKVPNAFGKPTKHKLYIHHYAFESEYILENSLRFWFENFVKGEQIRPPRTLRALDGANPLYIIIYETNVFIMDVDCNGYTEELWKELTTDAREIFDPNKEAIIIELRCDGPLEWKQNPPDLRRR
jgi:type VI protein secretion system component Hcp